ncbi:MAG: cyclodeaminase/cyclohydrolase family protein [Chloroflexota bacterium]|nr:cyclodeaminase/cyclohydrolase family protein [Chloroflexota bacterium]
MTEYQTLGSYLEAVGSGAPTPGGGSVAGIVAALAAALAEMVANLTLQHITDVERQRDVEFTRLHAHHLRTQCVTLAQADAAAYADYIAATHLCRDSPDEIEFRRAAIQVALAGASNVPMDLANACLQIFDVLQAIVPLAKPHALSDVEAAGHFAQAAAFSAIAMIRANAKLMKLADVTADAFDQAHTLERTMLSAVDSLATILAERG